MKRLVLAGVLALGFHALLLTAKVEWKNKKVSSPPAPIRIALTYGTPKIQEALPPPVEAPREEPPKAPESPVEKLKELKNDTVPQNKEILPKKKWPQKAQEQKVVPEIREAAEVFKAKHMVDETAETVTAVDTLPPIQAKVEKPMTWGTSKNLSPLPRSAAQPPPGPSKHAVPLYLKNPPPEYPPAARRRGYEGTVMLDVFVDAEGRVQEIRLIKSSGYAILDRAAIRAVKGWLFEPAREGEGEVAMWVKVPLTFRLKD
ncbi:MAG: energy transducer TonB [Deltaproteobacteria bacterium]|nr:energy transducer TonB [Deltaproteobacteria bacterium]